MRARLSAYEIFLTAAAVVLGFLATFLGWGIYLYMKDSLVRRMEIFVGEEYVKANIEIDVKKEIGEVKAVWTGFAQGGEEQQKNMLAGTEQVLKKVKPSYVRLDHIFDDDYYDVVKEENGQLKTDFSRLDETIRSIEKMGAKPFFSLGYMPSKIASGKIEKPYDWNKWQWLVEELIKHYSGKNGMNIDKVYYEVWNEPDLESFGYWKYYGEKSYLDLYRYAALGAKKLRDNGSINSFKFGGPATTDLYKNWVTSLVNFCENNNLPLDFVSWHKYSYYPSLFASDLLSLADWLEGKDYELIISEWGPDSSKTAVYSGYLASSHAVAVTRKMIEGLDWAYAFEVKDGPGQSNEGWGIFRHEEAGLSYKPRYKAFEMMKNMNGLRVELKGEGSNILGWAVKRDENLYIILANYNLNGGEKEEVPVNFFNLDEESEYLLIWEKMIGTGGNETVFSDEGKIEKIFEMDRNEIIKIRLEKLYSEENLSEFGKLMKKQN